MAHNGVPVVWPLKIRSEFQKHLFPTASSTAILSRCPPGHFLPDGIPVDGHAGRKAVQYGADGAPWDSPKIVRPMVCPKVFILSFLLFNDAAQLLEILPEVGVGFTDAVGAFNSQGLTAAL